MSEAKPTATTPNGYLMIFRGTDWHKGMSPEQMQEVFQRWKDWFERLMQEGRVAGGNPLENRGKVLAGANGKIVSDGPFTESKEAIGGYFLLTVETEDEALEIARMCPGLPFGVRVEVRPIAERCPMAPKEYAESSRAEVVA